MAERAARPGTQLPIDDDDGDEFCCPFDDCEHESFERIEKWLDHQKDSHGVEGPL